MDAQFILIVIIVLCLIFIDMRLAILLVVGLVFYNKYFTHQQCDKINDLVEEDTDNVLPDPQPEKQCDNVPSGMNMSFYRGDYSTGELADDKITRISKERSEKTHDNILRSVRSTKNVFMPYLAEELKNHENSVWWEDEVNMEHRM